MASVIYLTAKGLQRKHEQLERLRKQYFDVCASNEEAAGSGDSSVWHDNFAYEENQRQMIQLSLRVRDLESLLSRVEIVAPAVRVPEKVRLGTRVRLWCEEEACEKVFYIAGYDDGAPEEARISYNCPMGQALIALEEGDSCEVKGANKVQRYDVLEILPAPEDEIL